jgi:hypothetical protein
MSWRAQNRSKDAKTPSVARAMSRNPKLALCGIQPYPYGKWQEQLITKHQGQKKARATAKSKACRFAFAEFGIGTVAVGTGVRVRGLGDWLSSAWRF